MKKTALAMLTALVCTQVSAQQLSADILLDMAGCITYDCISDRATATGYKIELNKENEGYKTYVFRSENLYKNQSNPAVAKPNRLQLTLIKQDYSITLNYITGSQKERDLLLADFKKEGFSYVRSTEDKMSVSDNVAIEYKSPQYPKVTLMVANHHREKDQNAEKIDRGFDSQQDQGETYDEYSFELQWLFVPPPSERHDENK
ncbi:MAG TPA: hypothetical protein VIN07_07865 [Flavipsychrobacter sp.]